MSVEIIYIKHIVVEIKNYFEQFDLNVEFNGIMFDANEIIKNSICKLQMLF